MKEWQFRTLAGLGGLVLVVTVVNIFLFLHNRSLQLQVNNRQIYINQSMQLDQLNREIIAAITNLATKNNDDDLKQLLAAHGITFAPAASGPASATAQSSGKGKK